MPYTFHHFGPGGSKWSRWRHPENDVSGVWFVSVEVIHGFSDLISPMDPLNRLGPLGKRGELVMTSRFLELLSAAILKKRVIEEITSAVSSAHSTLPHSQFTHLDADESLTIPTLLTSFSGWRHLDDFDHPGPKWRNCDDVVIFRTFIGGQLEKEFHLG